MAPVPLPTTLPQSGQQSFGRRVAAKVGSLIAKFEAMAVAPLPPSSPPRKRTIASVIGTSGGSFSRRAKTLSKKASRIFARLEKEAERLPPPPKITPPPKRILRPSRSVYGRRGRRRATMPVGTPKEYPAKRRRTLSETLHDRPATGNAVEGGHSGFPLDGPVSRFTSGVASESSTEYTSVSSQVNSTPPVAKILPSSFFSQLVMADPRRIQTPRPRIVSDSEDSQLLIVEKREKIDPRKFRLHHSLDKKQSLWRRKITPPKISVKDLISRFRAEDAPPAAVEPKHAEVAAPAQASIVPNRDDHPHGSGSPEMSSEKDDFHSIVVPSDSPGIPTPPRVSGAESSPLPLAGKGQPNHANPRGTEKKTHTEEHPLLELEESSCLTSAAAASASKGVSRNPTIRLVTAAGENSGLIMPTLASVGNTQEPDSANKPAPYAAPTRLDTPPAKSTKKYRKTPPPEGFFRARRPRYSATPSLYTLTDESEDEKYSLSERSSTVRTSTSSSGSYYHSSSDRSSLAGRRIIISSKMGGIQISTGVPAASIVTPVPVNAVTSVAIQELVSRVWGT